MPKLNGIEAVPAEVNCAVPRIAMSWQYFAVASQKSTTPGVTVFPPEVTSAVSVTAVCAGTVGEERISVVVEGEGVLAHVVPGTPRPSMSSRYEIIRT
jgi:hypothetical protein